MARPASKPRPPLQPASAAVEAVRGLIDAAALAGEAVVRGKQGPKASDVHRLRGLCRRSEVALSVLSEISLVGNGAKEAAGLIRGVQRLRRGAGGVRDADVARKLAKAHFDESSGTHPGDDEALECVLDLLKRRRKKAQRVLLEACARLPADKLRKRLERLAAVSGTMAGPTRLGPALATSLVKCASNAAALLDLPLDHPEHLHTLRLALKRLRFIADLAGPRLDPDRARAAKRLARRTKTLTDQLGDAHDLVLLTELLRDVERSSPRPSKAARKALKRHRKALAARCGRAHLHAAAETPENVRELVELAQAV